MNDKIRLEWADRLSAIKRKYELPETPIRTEILAGGSSSSIAESIIDFSNKESTELIVIGNMGLSRASKVNTL